MLDTVALDLLVAPSTFANPLSSLATLTDAIKLTAAQAGAAMIGPATSVLGATVAVRIVRAWLESAFDGDSLSLINEAILNVVIATILMMGLNNYAAISSFVWGLGMDAMSLFGGGQSGQNIMDTIWGGSIKAMVDLTTMITTPSKVDPCEGMGGVLNGAAWMACKAEAAIIDTGGNLIVAIFVLLGMLMLLIFLAIMLFQVMRGVFQIAVALAWLPLTMGFYPLIDSWFKNAVGMIASGIANMAMIAFLINAMSNVITTIVSEATSNNIVALPAVAGLTAGAVNKITGVLIACLGIMVIAFLSSAAMSYGTSIFGATSGWGSIKTGKPSGGGKKDSPSGGDKGGGVGGGGGPAGAAVDAAGDAAKVGATVAAGVATGGVAAAGGAVASGAGSRVLGAAGRALKFYARNANND